MSTTEPEGQPVPTEEELHAAYEAEIRKVRIEHLLLEHVVTLVNLGMRRTGIAPGTEGERDPAQVRMAIEAIRALVPLLEQSAPQQVGPIRDALSQLQLAFVKIGGQEAAGGQEVPAPAAPPGTEPSPAEPAPESTKPGEAGPAQSSGRLWVPGQ